MLRCCGVPTRRSLVAFGRREMMPSGRGASWQVPSWVISQIETNEQPTPSLWLCLLRIGDVRVHKTGQLLSLEMWQGRFSQNAGPRAQDQCRKSRPRVVGLDELFRLYDLCSQMDCAWMMSSWKLGPNFKLSLGQCSCLGRWLAGSERAGDGALKTVRDARPSRRSLSNDWSDFCLSLVASVTAAAASILGLDLRLKTLSEVGLSLDRRRVTTG